MSDPTKVPVLPPTPTLDKRSAVIEKSHAIGEFLDWLSEQGIHFARWEKVEGYRDERLFTIHEGPSQLLHRYFEIDPKAEEEELRALLEHHLALLEHHRQMNAVPHG